MITNRTQQYDEWSLDLEIDPQRDLTRRHPESTDLHQGSCHFPPEVDLEFCCDQDHTPGFIRADDLLLSMDCDLLQSLGKKIPPNHLLILPIYRVCNTIERTSELSEEEIFWNDLAYYPLSQLSA